MFTGSLRVKICEASDLRPTDYQKRHELNFGKNNDKRDLDPYVSLNVDEKFIGEYQSASQNVRKMHQKSFREKFESIKMGQAIESIHFPKTFFLSLSLSLSRLPLPPPPPPPPNFSPLTIFSRGRQSSAMSHAQCDEKRNFLFLHATCLHDKAISQCIVIFPLSLSLSPILSLYKDELLPTIFFLQIFFL